MNKAEDASLDFRGGVAAAHERLRGDVIWTRLLPSPQLGREFGAEVFLKLEGEQPTGSFKIRGATNKMKLLTADERGRGIVAASTGNHGLAVAEAARRAGAAVTLFVPRSLSSEKRRRLESLASARLEPVDGPCDKAELLARRFASDSGRVFISPYNDPDVILGQGTAGLEILRDLPGLTDIIVPLGGGGLIAGIGGYLKTASPSVRVLGVEPVNSRFMAESLKAGRIVDVPERETLAEAVAGGIEPGSITFPLCRRFVDDIILVEERTIARSMALLFERHGIVVEGAGALALAGMTAAAGRWRGRSVVLVLSGGNISPQAHREIVSAAGAGD